ncbi:MAG: hypothetical protein IAE83_19800 [Anaerolinea sp.]|nr:hypothetical protein [Anaerolinea sp.]
MSRIHLSDMSDYDDQSNAHFSNSLGDYEEYEAEFDPLRHDRKARRRRNPKPKHTPKKQAHQVIEEIADTDGLEAGFVTTYTPGLFEEGWLLESLRTFYDQALISDVLARVKGGKEANVYRCKAHPTAGSDLFAAKVYRPRMFRNLRNDKMYREGRAMLNAAGHEIKKNEHRLMRAIGKKTSFGQEVAHTSWLMYEYVTLEKLHQAGADVPKPIVANENAILMSYCGDEHTAAPTLSEIQLDYDEALPIFNRVLRNLEIMVKHDVIHGDLSAYNILYWEGSITFIDFPQVVNGQNPNARFIFNRDVARVCEYFAKCGIERDPVQLANRLWQRHFAKRPADEMADLSRFEDEQAEAE